MSKFSLWIKGRRGRDIKGFVVGICLIGSYSLLQIHRSSNLLRINHKLIGGKINKFLLMILGKYTTQDTIREVV